jgi:uncharacterized protein
MPTDLVVPGLPFSLSASTDAEWTVNEADGVVACLAHPHSDIFIDPSSTTPLSAESLLNAVTLLGSPPEGDFQLSARVTVEFAETFDAGVLLLWVDDRHWGKLCFEYSPQGNPMVVSVVARGVSDDANAFVVSDHSVWLRVSRLDDVFAYHASLDGRQWQMVRVFTVTDGPASVTIGFEAQSPNGEGCRAEFDDIRFLRERLGDLRDGS